MSQAETKGFTGNRVVFTITMVQKLQKTDKTIIRLISHEIHTNRGFGGQGIKKYSQNCVHLPSARTRAKIFKNVCKIHVVY